MDALTILIFLFTLIFSFGVNALVIHSKNAPIVVRKLLYAPSYRSEDSAVLLGGLGLYCGICFALFYDVGQTFGLSSSLEWFLPATIITALGYYDDKYEIRARYKLLFQLTALVSLTILRQVFVGGDLISFAIEALFIIPFGIICLNGANLLDGLDTISVKYMAACNTLFFGLGVYFNIPELINFSAISFVPLISFYWYNRSPAKMYLGEIGGTLMGFNVFYMSVLLFSGYTRSGGNPVNGIALSFLGMYLPALELGVSFVRRIANNKSPFFGDRLHLHYLLVDVYKMKPSKASSIAALPHLLIGAFSVLMLSLGLSPLFTFIAVTVLALSGHYGFCYRFWHYPVDKKDENKILAFKGERRISYIEKNILLEDSVDAENILFYGT